MNFPLFSLTKLLISFSCICFVAGFAVNGAATPPKILTQEKLKVGDRIRFSFMGREALGEIIEVKKNGWYRVKTRGRNGLQERLVTPSKFLGRAGAKSGNKGSGGKGSSSEYQVWTDRSGNTLEAKFIELSGGAVKLKKKDGESITVNLTDLSIADIQRATRMTANKAFGKDLTDESDVDLDDDLTDGSEEGLVDFDFDGARSVEVKVSDWNLKREPFNLVADWELNQSFSMRLEASHSAGVLIDPRNPAIGFVLGTSVGKHPTGFLFDCKSGRTVGPYTITSPERATILAYDAVRHRLLTSSSWSRLSTTLDVWKVGRNDIELEFRFYPYPKDAKLKPSPTSGIFIDDDRIAITTRNQIAVYDLTNKRGLYAMKFDGMCRPQLHHGGEFGFGTSDNHVVALDLKAGKVVGKSPVKLVTSSPKNRQPTQLFSISPDMTRVVSMKRRFLEVYDLASGERLEYFLLPAVREQWPIFLDDENILVSNPIGSWASLVNIPLRSAIWKFTFCHMTFGPLGSQQVWRSADKTVGSMNGWSGTFKTTGTSLPQESARQVIESLKLKDLIVLQRGDSVSLDVKAAGEKGTTAIKNQLQAIGINIDPNSPKLLKATTGSGPTTTDTFQNVTGGGSQSVTNTSSYFELALIQNGEKVWYFGGGSSTKNLGNLVVINEGDSLNKMANAGRIGSEEFFSSVELPEQFIKVPPKGYYGFTNAFEEFDEE